MDAMPPVVVGSASSDEVSVIALGKACCVLSGSRGLAHKSHRG